MSEILLKFYDEILKRKNLAIEEKEKLFSFLTSDNPVFYEELKEINFSLEELNYLGEHLVNDNIFLRNFLRYNLYFEKYETVINFLRKIFVSHIGKNTFVSKNSESYNAVQRTFDRFLEATMWTGIEFEEWKEMLLNALKSSHYKAISQWKAPAKDYLIDWVVRDDKAFYDFLFKNFSEFGMPIFNVLISEKVSSAIPKLVDFWFENDFYEKRQVKNVLKQHKEEVLKYLKELEDAQNISTKKLAQLLLIYSKDVDVKNKLLTILNKEKDFETKKLILEKTDLRLEERTMTLLQAKKNSQKMEIEGLRFFGLEPKDFPKLVFKNDEEAEQEFVAYYLACYRELFSPKASCELKFFKKLLKPESMDDFSLLVVSKMVNDKNNNNDWAVCLLQNSTNSGAIKIMRKMLELNENNYLNKFIKQLIFERKEDLKDIFNSLNRKDHLEKLIQDALLKSFIEANVFESNEIELLKDKVVPEFELKEDGTLEVDGYVLKINKHFEVESCKTFEDLPKNVQIEMKRLQREIEKQTKRLENAFHNARMWTEKEFETAILDNSLMQYLSQNLLWAKYNEGNIVSVFCLKGKEKKKILSIDTEINCVIGLFHPVELNDYDLKTLFVGRNAPFNQIYIEVHKKSSYNSHNSFVNKFNGFLVNFLDFFEKIKEKGWKLSLPTLDGYVSSIQKVNPDLNMLAEISFAPVSLEKLDELTVIGELRFYNLDDVLKTGNNYVVDRANSLEISAILDRFFSDMIYEINSSIKSNRFK